MDLRNIDWLYRTLNLQKVTLFRKKKAEQFHPLCKGIQDKRIAKLCKQLVMCQILNEGIVKNLHSICTVQIIVTCCYISLVCRAFGNAQNVD